MAVLKYNTADGGSNGTVVTVANSGGGSGNAWANVTANVWTYSNEQTVKGSLAYKGVQGSGASALLQMSFASSTATHYGRCYVYLTSFATGEHPIVRGYTTGFGEAWRIGINATGQLRIRDASTALLTTTTQTITTGTWWRLEWRVVNGTGTSGQLEVKAFSGDSTTASITYTNAACNTAATTDHIHFGPSLSSPQVPTQYLDEITTDNAAYPGPANVVNQPPTANAGPDQNVIEGSTVTLNATGSSDIDGTIASFAWVQTAGNSVSLSSASDAQPTFTAPAAPATLTFQLTVTDNSGATATDTVTITVGSSLFRFNKAEGGTIGAVVSAANSGGASGDAWNTVGSATAWTYTSTNVVRGSLGYQCSQQSAEAATLTWSFTPITEVYGRCYYYLTGYGSGSQTILRLFATGGVNECFRADLLNTGQIRLRDAATNILSTSTPTLVTGVWYRFEWHVVSGTSNGVLEFRVYVADQSTPIYTYTNTACNTSTELAICQFGPGFSTVVLPTMFADEFALNLNGWIGTAPGTLLNGPPVANAGPDQNTTAGSTVTLNATGSSDADGTITSYSWSQISGTSVTLSSSSVTQPTFTAPAGPASLVFQLTITDDDGATATDTVTITVLASILFQNTGEGGTDGQAVTTGNSGGASGNAWQSVNGNAWTYSSAHTARGGLSYKCDQNTGAAATLQWQLSSVAEHYGRVYLYYSALAATSDPFVRAFATGFAEAFRLELNAGGNLVVRNSAGVAQYTSSAAFSAGTWYRVEWHAVSGTSTGQLEVRVYVADQSTPIISYSSTASLSIRSETSWIQFGPSFGLTPAPASKWFDELIIGSAGAGWLGSAPGTPINQIPVVSAGPDVVVEPKSVVSLTGSATDDGTIVSWQWQQLSGPSVALSSANVQNPTFAAPAIQGGTTLTFGLTATDDGGSTSAQDTVTITVLTPTVYYARSGSWQP